MKSMMRFLFQSGNLFQLQGGGEDGWWTSPGSTFPNCKKKELGKSRSLVSIFAQVAIATCSSLFEKKVKQEDNYRLLESSSTDFRFQISDLKSTIYDLQLEHNERYSPKDLSPPKVIQK